MQPLVLRTFMFAGHCDSDVEQLRNIGIINSTTRLHLVVSFYEIYITMHGSLNIKLTLILLMWRIG
jgi:hypothetical protein